MKNISEILFFTVKGKGMYDITKDTIDWIHKNKLNHGQLNLFIQHTSASLSIMENASQDVLEDIDNFFLKIVPEDSSLYAHGNEGDDDMPAHIKSMLTQTSLTIPVNKGNPLLGTWQGIYLFEHRYHSKNREINYSFIGI